MFMFDPKQHQRCRRMINKIQSAMSRTKDAKPRHRRAQAGGQAMVEYALIAVLVMLGLVTILTVTAPAIGNVFSNTVYNLLGQQFTPYSTLGSGDKLNLATTVGSYTPYKATYETNTPLAPTCYPAHPTRTWAPTAPGAEGTFVMNPCP